MANLSHTTTISDLGPWDEKTIALLFGLSLSEVSIKLLGKDPAVNNNTHKAQLTFSSQKQMHRIIQAYNGLAIPMTHGYHYYTFDDQQQVHTDGGMTETPPLHLQLMALTTNELERRVKRYYGQIDKRNVKFSNNKRDKVYHHADLAYQLSSVMKSRRINYYRGVPVSKDSTVQLLTYLRSCPLWPTKQAQRKGVTSLNYLTVRKQHSIEYNPIWDMCRDLIHTVAPDAIYNALAITNGFSGSPHVDLHDKTFQYVIALGEFEGGQLCCEGDENGLETVAIDVDCRFGRIDGRAVHWVNGWSGERYSIVYYSTDKMDETERLSQVNHTEWMVRHHKQDVKTEKVPLKMYGMENPRLPSVLPIVGLGCSSFSTFFSSNNDALTVDTINKDHLLVQGWIETIRHAVLDRGICLLDTAPWYGHGISEKVVGYALDTILSNDSSFANDTADADSDCFHFPQRPRTGLLHRSNLILNTKVGRYEADPIKQFDFSYSTTIKSVRRSLNRMNCEYIDVLQLHDPEFAPNMNILMKETIPALMECRKRGWTKAVGLTGYPLEVQHEILVKCSKNFKDGLIFDQSLVYCHNNLHDMSLFRGSCCMLSSGTDTSDSKASMVTFAAFCQQSGISLICAAPLSMGLLTNFTPPNWHPAPSSLKEACAEAAALCRSIDVDISSLAILYSLSQREIGCTLVGMKDIAEVDTAADLAVRFSGIDFNRICTNQSHDDLTPVLSEVLTPAEKDACLRVLNRERGPFKDVWASGNYQWDGKAEAEKFWVLVHQLKKADTEI